MAQACAGQLKLRKKLEQLLETHDRSGDLLEQPTATPTIKQDLHPEELPGSSSGHYKLLQKIGEEGMGVVYMAEQIEPVMRNKRNREAEPLRRESAEVNVRA